MSKKLTTEEFKTKMFNQHGNDYEVLGEYINGRTKILIRHKCGYEFTARPDYISTVRRGYGCPICSGNYKSLPSCLRQSEANLWKTDPDIAKYLNNPEDGYNVMRGSKKVLEWKCPICGHIQNRKIHTIKANGFICEVCNDGFSKPEKFMRSVLMQLGIDFKMQVKFDWAKNKKYDFYFDGIICETHGLQHYEHSFQCNSARTLEEEQLNDTYKEKIAKENGFTDDTYIVIDCRKTDKEWIKNSILHSKLADHYDLSMIDWDKCEKDTLSSIVIEICNLWNQGYSTSDIKRKMHLSKNTSTVSKYLNICNSLGLCNYDPKQSQKDGSNHKVVCLNTREVFDSVTIAEDAYNVQNVSGCCIGQIKSAGKHPETKESLVWRHYEDYINMSEEDIKLALDVKSKKLRKVICTTTMQVFDSLVEGATYAGLKTTSSLSACLRNEQKHAGKHYKTGEPLSWMRYDKYLESVNF